MSSHNGLYGVWHWQYLCERLAEKVVINFQRISHAGGATLFDFVVVHNDGNCTPGSKSAVYVCLVFNCNNQPGISPFPMTLDDLPGHCTHCKAFLIQYLAGDDNFADCHRLYSAELTCENTERSAVPLS